MKKFILLAALVALLSGCATENPYYRNAQVLGGTVAGGVVGYKVGGPLGAVVGGVAGHEIVKGAQWDPNADEVVVIQSGGQPYGYGYGNGSQYHSVTCIPYSRDGYPFEPGHCRGPGGEPVDINFNPCFLSHGIIGPCPRAPVARPYAASYAQPQGAVVRYQEPPLYTTYRMPTGESKKEEKKAEPRRLNSPLTVENYRKSEELPSDCKCQTGNWGADSMRLRERAALLAELQHSCEAGEENEECSLNPGVRAAQYLQLADDLKKQQERAQGGRIISSQ